jgi:hypothetical protein
MGSLAGTAKHTKPNETVEKVHFSYFLRKTPFENQESMSDDFQVLGFFDSLNRRLPRPPEVQYTQGNYGAGH